MSASYNCRSALLAAWRGERDAYVPAAPPAAPRLDAAMVLRALGLAAPDAFVSDREAARAAHLDLADLDDAALADERRRAAIAAALWPRGSAAAMWWREREAAVIAEQRRRTAGARR